MSCGVYAIINRHNGKLYIGSSIDIENRWNDHLSLLRRGKHNNYYLQSIYNGHGKEGLEFKIIEECKEDCLRQREQYWIYRYNSTNFQCGYNISLDTTAPMRGRELSDKQKEAIGKQKKKQAEEGLTEEHKKHLSISHLKYSHLVNDWKDLFKQGCSCREIGRRYNLHQDIISKYLKKYFPSDSIKIFKGRNEIVLNNEAIERIILLRNQGLNYNKIASLCDTTAYIVKKHLR